MAPRARREHARGIAHGQPPPPAFSKHCSYSREGEWTDDEDLLGHPAHGRQASRQPDRRLPPVRRDPGAGRGVLLHRRPALDHRRLRPRRPAHAHVRPRGDALRDRARPGALDRVLPEPRDGARRGGVAALGRDELRTAGPDDAVQGEVGATRLHLRGPLHVPGADGRRHPALPDRHRPDRRRPAPAPRARPRRRRALQRTVRGDVRRARGRLPGGRRADHGPPGADEEDVDDRRDRAGNGADARRARRSSAASSSRPSPTPAARYAAPATSPA